MNDNKINAAIQLLPSGEKNTSWEIIENAIELISKSGLTYRVCPFETVVEGSMDQVYSLIKEIRNMCYANGANEFIINLKLQFDKNKDVFINDKMKKFENQ